MSAPKISVAVHDLAALIHLIEGGRHNLDPTYLEQEAVDRLRAALDQHTATTDPQPADTAGYPASPTQRSWVERWK